VFSFIQEATTKLLGTRLIASQLQCFIAVVYGLLAGEQAGIAVIGRKMPGEAKAKSKMNRVYRFVSNPRVNVESICMAIIGSLGMIGKRVVVATDWTEIGPLSVLASAVVTYGRAIPIYWTVIDTTHTRKMAVEVEHMRRLSGMLLGVEAIHVLDRGFDRGGFLKEINGICKYVVRLSCGFLYRKKGESEFKQVDNFGIKRGRRHDLGEVEYTHSHMTRCRLVLFHDHKQKGPWLLATNRYRDSRATIIECYSRRFRIEEGFKDLKDLRAGFGLHGYRMEKTDHLCRLLAVVAVGYLLISASGHYGEEHDKQKSLQINTRKTRELASWRVGLELVTKGQMLAQEAHDHIRQLPSFFESQLEQEEQSDEAA
jgi:hypothetical protein